MKQETKKGFFYGITANVILFGIVSFFVDMSSEIIVPIIPLFMKSLGASALMIGLLGGLSESVISMMQFLSGYWADITGKRKIFVISGYSICAFIKLLMSFATSWVAILILRPIERIGKGMREPPRDAILAETTPKEVHGKVFGIHRAFDTAGAIIGSTLAFILMSAGIAYSNIFLIAAGIAFISIIPLFLTKEKAAKPKKIPLKIGLKNLPPKLKAFIIVSAIFALANFSYMFLILKAQTILPITSAIMLYILFNLSYEFFAIPSGIIADKLGENLVILSGYFVFAAVCMVFALTNEPYVYALGFILYGLSNALVVGNERAFAADLSGKEIGTCLGTFHAVISFVSLPAGLIAGALWQFICPEATFYFGAALAVVAAITFIVLNIEHPEEPKEHEEKIKEL